MNLVGVPKVDGEWDVSWLWRDAGYLEGSAFPTHSGNSIITGHVYLPNGLPGPFLNISSLKWGDRIIIHAYGQSFIYEVRKVDYLKPADVAKAFEHKDDPWITLLTCHSYDEKSNSYRQRVAVKAVLVKVMR
jgi:LPXTG-site transpeptidase (sortase) family protein